MVSFFAYQAIREQMKPVAVVSVGSTVFKTEIADTDALRERGLSGRPNLANDEAMLLAFPKNDRWGIWMKNMNFSLDVVWLDEKKKVVHIEHDLQPDAEPYNIYEPLVPARYVLEMKAGRAKQSNIKVGSPAKIQLSGKEYELNE